MMVCILGSCIISLFLMEFKALKTDNSWNIFAMKLQSIRVLFVNKML